MFNVEFWLAVSFIILLALIYRPVKTKLISALDQRSLKIKQQIEEADLALAQANKLLQAIKEKYKNLEVELMEISKNTEKEIKIMQMESEKIRDEYLNRRNSLMNNKIESETRNLLNQLREESVLVATRVAKDILKENISEKEAKKDREEALDKILATVKN